MLHHLVRHGRPAIDRDRPAASWKLRGDAASDVMALRERGVLPGRDAARFSAAWFSSDEPKAVQTARLLHDDAQVDHGFREAARPAGWLSQQDFDAAVQESFRTPDLASRPGWEALADTRTRILDALLRSLVQASSLGVDDVVVVGHGTAWTLLVASLTGAAPDLSAWAAMGMPDHCTLDLPALQLDGLAVARSRRDGSFAARIVRPWGSWRSQPGQGTPGAS